MIYYKRKFNIMKRNYAFLKAILLSFTIIFGIEYGLIVITADYELCFWHNTILGNILAWSARIITFSVLTSVFTSFFLPAFKTLRERMLEKQENNAPVRKEKELILDKYVLKQAR